MHGFTKHTFFVILLLQILPVRNDALAQDRVTLFKNFTIDQGLSFNTINHFEEDYLGFIWIATDNGLNRFDGIDFTSYHKSTRQNDLANDRILHIFEDSFLTLWICTDGGLHTYNREKDNFNRITLPGINISKGENAIVDIAQDAKGIIWILTESTLIRHEGGTNNFEKIETPQHFPENRFTKLTIVSDTLLWIGTNVKGIMEYNTFTHNAQFLYGDKFPNGVTQCISDGDQNLYIGSQEGILRLTGPGRTEKWYPVENNIPESRNFQIWDMELDADGYLWLATDNRGLLLVNKDLTLTNSIINQQGRDNSLFGILIRRVFHDRNNNLWLGTQNHGVFFQPAFENNNFNILIPPCKTNIENCIKNTTAIVELPNGEIWLGTDGNGLFRFDKKSDNYKQYMFGKPEKSGNSICSVLDILPINDELFLLAFFDGGLGKFNPKSGKLEKIKLISPSNNQPITSTRDLLLDKSGNIWIATHRDGLLKYDLNKGLLKQYLHNINQLGTTLCNDYTLCMMEDINGKLWVGTYFGLSRFDPAKETFQSYFYNNSDSTSLPHSWVYALHQDKNHTVWIGTVDGVCRFNPTTNNFTRIKLEAITSNKTINGLLSDEKNNLWLSTNKGILVYNTETNRTMQFTTDDGLPGNIFLHGGYTKGYSGRLYFGATFGAVSFDPNAAAKDTISPVVILKRLILDYRIVQVRSEQNPNSPLQENISVAKKILIPYKYKQIAFEFTGIYLKAPFSVQYQYKLDGFDKEWIHIGAEHRITFNNLNPGKYTLSIKASNKYGYAGQVQSLTLIIVPPWWKTKLFYGICTLIFFGLIILFIIIRESSLKASNKILEEKVVLRTREITQQNEEIKRQSSEIIIQKQHIEKQSEELSEKASILEEQAEELMASNEKLLESNATKDRFFSIIAHDLKNPFGTLLGFIELIDTRYDVYNDAKKKNLLKVIASASKNVYNLLENLLNWSRSQRGLIIVNPQNINLEVMILEILELFNANFKEKNHTISYNFSEDAKMVFADDNLLNTILRNLISNAIKFTPNNGFISVSTARLVNSIEISVKDSGIGIVEEEIKKLFRIDQHITTQGTNNETGTGLGLILVHEFTKLLNGTINVKSTLNEGTIFCIELPIK